MRKVDTAFLDMPAITLEAVEELCIFFASVRPVVNRRAREALAQFAAVDKKCESSIAEDTDVALS